MKFFKKGFTLAEVLITLAVIGIVAIMTIPNLITGYNKTAYLTGLKKKYAEIQQVLQLSAIEKGGMSRWNWELDKEELISEYIAPYFNQMSKCEDCWLSYIHNTPTVMFFEQVAEAAPSLEVKCLTDAMNGIITESCQSTINNCITNEGNWGDFTGDMLGAYCADYYAWYLEQNSSVSEEPEITYSLADGSQLGFAFNKNKQILYLYFDVNGAKKPNKYGADRYVFMVTSNNISALGTGESDLTAGDYGCSAEGNKMYCAAMIIKNNWEYPDNYPNI